MELKDDIVPSEVDFMAVTTWFVLVVFFDVVVALAALATVVSTGAATICAGTVGTASWAA